MITIVPFVLVCLTALANYREGYRGDVHTSSWVLLLSEVAPFTLLLTPFFITYANIVDVMMATGFVVLGICCYSLPRLAWEWGAAAYVSKMAELLDERH